MRKLNEMDIPAAKGGNWSNSTVKDILRNPVYIGKIRWNYRPHVKRMIKGNFVPTPQGRRKDWILTDGLHEPIINEDTYEQAQKRLSNNSASLFRAGMKSKPAGRIDHLRHMRKENVAKTLQKRSSFLPYMQHPSCTLM